MNRIPQMVLVSSLLFTCHCAGPSIPHEPDLIDVTLQAPADQVRNAVVQVLTDGGYDVEQRDEEHLTTGYRKEISGPWDWLLRWRFGTNRSRVDALVTPETGTSARLRLNVLYEGKDGLFTRWEESPTALPQNAETQVRLIKNALHLL
ncbi:MAG TPA: hypothetical protein VJ746_06070 [Nitrospira sp.]|nr:hypothetical protein [Nitrospira sp.]